MPRRLASIPFSRRHLQGLALIIIVSFLWVGGSFLTQGLVTDGMPPLLLTYLANSLFVIYLPITWLAQHLQRITGMIKGSSKTLLLPSMSLDATPHPTTLSHDPNRLRTSSHATTSSSSPNDDDTRPLRTSSSSSPPHPLTTTTNPTPLLLSLLPASTPHRNLVHTAALVAPLWLLAQFSFNLSLSYTSVTSNTILSSTASVYTFIFSVLAGRELFTRNKLSSVLATVLGVIFVALADTTSVSDTSTTHGGGTGQGSTMRTMEGDALCLLSAMTYAMYTLQLKERLRDDSQLETARFFGYMGSLTLLCVSPIIMVYYAAGWLATASKQGVGWVLVKGLTSNVLSDYLWARAVLLIGPTAASCGLALQIPIAIVLETLLGWGGYSVPGTANDRTSFWARCMTFVGTVSVIGGFIGINLEEREEVGDGGRG